MRLTIRFDKDLLTLGSIPGFNVRGWIRDTIGIYASTGEIRKTPLPAAPPDRPVLKDKMFSITFDEVKDAAVVELLRAVQDKQRSSAIKSILRSSLSRPCLYAHFNIYPAPFPVIRTENSEPLKQPDGHDATVEISQVGIQEIPLDQGSSDMAKDFNIFEFDDRIG